MSEILKFQFNKQKAIEAILYLTNIRSDLSVMHLLKFLFYADVYHLEHYDRPVLGGVYYAMKNGPVATNVYDLLKCSCSDYKLQGSFIKIIKPNRQADLDYFSDSDIEALNFVLEKYKNLSAEDLSEETHKTNAWKKAWFNKPFWSQRAPMNYEDFYTIELSSEKLEYLREYSELMVF